MITIHYPLSSIQYTLYVVRVQCTLYINLWYTQGCKSVSSIGGMILKFLIWTLLCPNSCFFYSFSPGFFDDLFFARQAFFTHFLQKCLKNYQYLSYLASSVLQNTFSFPAWWKNIRDFPAMGKNQNYWGGWRSNIGGGCIRPTPPGFAALGILV